MWFKHTLLIRDQFSQECLSNGGIGCLRRKRLLGINYQKHPRPPFWVTQNYPIILLPMSTFLMLLFIGTNIPYVPFVLTTPKRTWIKHIGTQTITARPNVRTRIYDHQDSTQLDSTPNRTRLKHIGMQKPIARPSLRKQSLVWPFSGQA